MEGKIKHIHFIGIGGIGMSGLAEIALNLSFSVSGSDIAESKITKRLEKLGAKIYIGHSKKNIGSADTIIVSSAIPKGNPEFVSAKNRGLKILMRGEFLSFIMKMKDGIAITGAHGKTTTTSLIAFLLQNAGLEPTAVIGGVVKSFGSNASFGKGRFFVCEADESDGSFLSLLPKIAVVTNMDKEHMEYFKNIRRMKSEYLSFINRSNFAILCFDDKYIKSILSKINVKYKTYGLKEGNILARNIKETKDGVSFEVFHNGSSLRNWKINLLGRHNVLNSLACISVGLFLSIPLNNIKEALKTFPGVERRLDIKRDNEIMVISDYGHHPTEIKETIRAIKKAFKRRLIVVFQPHRYTRTKYFLPKFANAFKGADMLILTEIYPSSEEPIPGIEGEVLYKKIAEDYQNVTYIPELTKIPKFLKDIVKSRDIILILGAGNINSIDEEI